MWQWGFPGATTKACPHEGGDRQEASCSRIKYGTGSEEVSAQDLRDAQDKMSMGHLFENIHAQPFPEFHHALLMAGWTKKRQDWMGSEQRKNSIFIAAIPSIQVIWFREKCIRHNLVQVADD